jgi:hypothetical protein
MSVVIAVLDYKLERHDELLAPSVPRIQLSPRQWVSAEAARREVEDGLRTLKESAAEASARARDWYEKAAIAEENGWTEGVGLARERAVEAENEYVVYAREIDATRVFLQEWGIRVTDAPPTGTPSLGQH